jgi:hypothetical protein
MRRPRLPQAVSKTDIGATHIIECHRQWFVLWTIRSGARFDFDYDLQRSVERVKEAAERTEPASAVVIGCSRKSDGPGGDGNSARGAIPTDCRSAMFDFDENGIEGSDHAASASGLRTAS